MKEDCGIISGSVGMPTCPHCGYPNGRFPEFNYKSCSCKPVVRNRAVGDGRPKPRKKVIRMMNFAPLVFNEDGTSYFDYSEPPPPLGHVSADNDRVDYTIKPPTSPNYMASMPNNGNNAPMADMDNIYVNNRQPININVANAMAANLASNQQLPYGNNTSLQYGINTPMQVANIPLVGYVVGYFSPAMQYPSNAPVTYVPRPDMSYSNSLAAYVTNPPYNYEMNNRIAIPIIALLTVRDNPYMAYANNNQINSAPQ